jgi:hypothetical protein
MNCSFFSRDLEINEHFKLVLNKKTTVAGKVTIAGGKEVINRNMILSNYFVCLRFFFPKYPLPQIRVEALIFWDT